MDLSSIQALIADMDGVFWKEDQPLIDIPRFFRELAAQGHKIILLSNNSTYTIEHFLSKFRYFGVDLQPWQILSSSMATALYLKNQFPAGGPLYWVGEEGLALPLKTNGFYFDAKNPLAVVIAMDRQLTYQSLSEAVLLIRSGVPFIGTNPDYNFPTPRGLVVGVGAILKAVEVASGKKPFVIGKPNPQFYQLALQRLDTSPPHTLVVGDRLDTDIAGGQLIGCPCALVLSGVSTREEALVWSPPLDLICPDLQAVVEVL